MKSLLPAALASCLAFTLIGCAHHSNQPRRSSNLTAQFQRADTNQDGQVSSSEFRYLMIEDMFALFDHNEDGFVTREEFLQAGGSPHTFAQIDRNNTGRVTLDQAKTARIKLDTVSATFLAADTDKDGFVSLEEALAYREKARAYTR